ncbi:MAG: hypothetical protein H6754_05460 [Candidatus Omnitrophica bacterium]|nr:hypothetical protein [Candidatus Omnitrophota bacterium]
MKKLFITTAFTFLLLNPLLVYAQNISQSPITQLKSIIQTPPPDPLQTTLEKINQNKNQKNSRTDDDSEEETQIEIFINPFVPQIPKDIKPVAVNPQNDNQNLQTQPVPVIPTPQFIVSGLIWNSKKPAAIMNGQVVAIGDQVSNWAISEITKDGVRVSYEDRSLWIKPIVDPMSQPQQATPGRRF